MTQIPDAFKHPDEDLGVKCALCNRMAVHKVGEEPPFIQQRQRHNFTTYLCCQHFGYIMGPMASNWCEHGDMLYASATAIDKRTPDPENNAVET